MGEEQGCWRVRHSSTAMRTKLCWQVGGYRTRLIISLAVLALLLVGCGSDKSQQTIVPTLVPTDAEDHESLKIYGPLGFKVGFGFVRPILDEWGLPYENYEIYEGPSTSAGIEGLLTGVFDVVTLMRHPLPDEPLMFMEMVHTPIGIFVNPDLGITNLTREQAAAIFTGEVTQWSEVGGPDVGIVVFVQEPDDTMTVTFQDLLLNGVDFAESAEVLLSEFDVFPVVEGLTGAVSYASVAGVKSMEADKMMEVINPINLDGLSPEDPDYWLISQIGLTWLPERQELVEPFLEWVVDVMDSSIARILMERYSVIPGNPVIPDVVSASGNG